MENVKQKMEELLEAVAAKGGNVIIIGDVKEEAEYKTVICQMHGKVHALAMDMARVAHRKDGEPIRGILEGANMMMDIVENVTKEATNLEVIKETTEEK